MKEPFFAFYEEGDHTVAAQTSNTDLDSMSALCEQESENIMENLRSSSEKEDSQSFPSSNRIQTNTVHIQSFGSLIEPKSLNL